MNKRNCPVICITTNKKFKTIREASRYAGADGWTMSVKMTVKGQYVDSLGRVYKRLRPMKSDKIYTSPTDTTTKRIPFHKRKKDIVESPVNVQEPVQEELPLKACPEFVKKAVADKIKDELKATPIWNHICEIMEYLGINEFTIKKD